MTKVIASPSADDSAPSNIIELRNAVGDAVKRQYGATKAYAIALCDFLPADWFEVEHNSLREEDKPVLAEAKAFRAALKAAGHSNPSVMWTRVRAEGKAHMHGPAEESATGPKPQRSFQLRLIEELTALFKAGKREESLSDQQQNAMTGIASALAALGVDISSITK
jgi:hypothetical protein